MAPLSKPPRRIQVRGISGAGKTTVARRLAALLDLPLVDLDELHWGPGWVEASAEELRAAVGTRIATGSWVVDGQYDGKLGTLVTDAADVLFWLDPPLTVALMRLARRTHRRIRTREVLFGGSVETWRTAVLGRESLFLWAVRSHLRSRRTWRTLPQDKLVRIRSDRELEHWLDAHARGR
jgi:adenylate kinase family enzyme